MSKSKIDTVTLFGMATILSRGNSELFGEILRAFVMASQPVNDPYWQQGRATKTLPYTGIKEQRTPR